MAARHTSLFAKSNLDIKIENFNEKIKNKKSQQDCLIALSVVSNEDLGISEANGRKLERSQGSAKLDKNGRQGWNLLCLFNFPWPSWNTPGEKMLFQRGGGWASQASLSYEIEKWLNLRAV